MSPSERALLGYFLAKLYRVDPDILVGHNLTSFGLEVLQHRLSACHVPQWSRVSRLKRKEMPRVREGWKHGWVDGWRGGSGRDRREGGWEESGDSKKY